MGEPLTEDEKKNLLGPFADAGGAAFSALLAHAQELKDRGQLEAWLKDRDALVDQIAEVITPPAVEDETADSLEDYLSDAFGFCGCGFPAPLLDYAREYLALLRDHPSGASVPPVDPVLEASWKKRSDCLDKAGPARALLMYVLAARGFTDHGGSVEYGWINDKGQEVLVKLERWKKLHDAEEAAEKEKA